MKKQIETLSAYYDAIIDSAEGKVFRRFGNGLYAGYSSFKFYCAAFGYYWKEKEERQIAEANWNEFRSNQEVLDQVKDSRGYFLTGVIVRTSYSMHKGLSYVKSHKYTRSASMAETAIWHQEQQEAIARRQSQAEKLETAKIGEKNVEIKVVKSVTAK